MRKRGLIVALVLGLMVTTLACGGIVGGPTKGSGTIIKAEKEVSGFSGVTLAAAGNLIIEVGSAEELRIEVDDNLVQQYAADVDSKMLTIKLKDGAQVEPTEEVNFYLTVKELDTIVLAGAGNVEVESVRAGQFSVELSGAGDIAMAGLNADSLDVEISGAGSLEIEAGWVNEQTVVLSGAGDYMAEGMQCGTASIEITGAGSATVWVATQLEVAGTGTGTVEYVGKPEVSAESITVKPVSE